MRYLLDTHTFLWVLFDDDKLSAGARNVLTDIDSEIYVSLVTYWEISLKYSLGKLDLTGIRPDELPQKAEETEIFSLEVSEEDMNQYLSTSKALKRRMMISEILTICPRFPMRRF